jgi:hypothetical protein
MVELPRITGSTLTVGAIGAVLGGIMGAGASTAISGHRTRKRKKHRDKSIRGKHRKLKFGSKAYRKRYLKHGKRRKTPHTAGKRRDTSRKRIRYTKKGQPYVITSHGKARFISKASASSSYKRKGGKY